MPEPGSPEDLYSLLGVPPDASEAQIQEAYRERARQVHPDRPQGDADLMARVNEARDVLSDPRRRRDYDRLRSRSRQAAEGEAVSQPWEEDPPDVSEEGGTGTPLGRVLRRLVVIGPLLAALAAALGVLGALIGVPGLVAVGVVGFFVSLVLLAMLPFLAMSARR